MRPRSWFPHVALLLIASAIFAISRVRHMSTERAFEIAFDPTASADDRIWAAHLAACRATERDSRLGTGLVEEFLASDDERLREAAVTIDLCRHADRPEGAPPDSAPPIQNEYVYSTLKEWTPHRLRSFVLYRRKVGGSRVGGKRRVKRDEVRWFIDTLQGRPLPPSDVVGDYILDRMLQPGLLYLGNDPPR